MNVLEGLRNTSKGQLQYDNHWQPTHQELDACARSPTVSCEFSAVIENLQTLNLLEDEKKSRNESDSSPDTRRDEKLDCTNSRSRGPEYFDTSHVNLFHYEEEKKLEAKKRIDERTRLFISHSDKLEDKKQCTLHQLAEERVNKFLENVQNLKQDLKNYDLLAERKQKALVLQHEKSAARASRKVQHVVELKKKIAEEEERNKKELLALHKCNQETSSIYRELEAVIRNCKFQVQLQPRIATIMEEAKKVMNLSLNALNDSECNGKAVDGALHHLLEYCMIMKTLLDKAKQAVNDTENKMKKEMAEKEAKIKEAAEAKRKEEAKKKEEKLKAASASQSLATSISTTSAAEYNRLERLLEQTIKTIVPFSSSSDQNTKKLKMALQRAVTTPINTISDQSPAHLVEKIKGLSLILSGQQTVDLFGKALSTSVHPDAPLYCRHLLALKIVQQGSQQVSSNHNAAFPIAAVAIGVWSAFPDVGDLILSQFYKQCPFLVPMYIPQSEGMSDKEYFNSLGYLCEDGEIEPRDKYLKRISGTIRLYAAIVSSMPPRGASPNHPHGITHGWMWLARVLNLPPKADYTATALFEFLDVAGHALQKQYRTQFWKLILVIVRELIPNIRQITSPSQSGPIVRLESFLEKAFHSRTMERPSGYLDDNWWNSAGFSGIYGN